MLRRARAGRGEFDVDGASGDTRRASDCVSIPAALGAGRGASTCTPSPDLRRVGEPAPY